MHVLLVHPEIAPNTGAIVRLCANTGAGLHLVEPLGFSLDDRLLRRGGLDYHEAASMTVHGSLTEARAVLPGRWFGFSARSTTSYVDIEFDDDDVLVFGAELAGLTDEAKSAILPNECSRSRCAQGTGVSIWRTPYRSWFTRRGDSVDSPERDPTTMG